MPENQAAGQYIDIEYIGSQRSMDGNDEMEFKRDLYNQTQGSRVAGGQASYLNMKMNSTKRSTSKYSG